MKLNEVQFQALQNYVDARIDEKIENAFGRDGLNEYLKKHNCLQELRQVLVEE